MLLVSFLRVVLSFILFLCFCVFNSFIIKDELGKVAFQLLIFGLMGEFLEFFSVLEDEGRREYQVNDSDFDGFILYIDDEEDEDEDGSGESKIFFKRQGGKWVVDRSSYVL